MIALIIGMGGNALARVFDKFAATAKAGAGDPFLHIPSDGANAATDVTYGQALAEIKTLSARYQAAGYGAGHRVALMFGNSAGFFTHWLALNSLGAAIVPLGSEGTPVELAYQISLCAPVLAVTTPENQARLQAAIAEAGAPVAIAITIAIAGDDMTLPQAATLAATPALDEIPTAETPCALLFTSGSTGKPKACILSNAYFTLFGEWYARLGGLCALKPGAERLLTPLPLTHMNALACSTMAMIETGGCLIQLDRFHPSTWWQTVRESRATAVHYLGVMPAILLGLDEQSVEREHSVRFGFGAGCDPRHQALFEDRFGFPLVEGWAMTETGSGGCIMANHEPRHVGSRCFGKADSAVDVRLVGNDGEDVAKNSPGELLVRAAGGDPRKGFFSGYYGNEAATAEAWRDDWLHTGDIVQAGDDGALHFVDRKKAIIRRSGENISASEVEGALLGLSFVAQAAVAPVPDEVREEEVMALIVLDGQAVDAKEILAALRAELSYFKLPGYIAFVDSIPLTASQKLQRGALKPLCQSLISEGRAVDVRHLKRRNRTG